MKSILKNNISTIHQEIIEHINSLLPLMVSDNYLFLDPKITIQTYSNNAEVFFNQIFKSKIIDGAPFFEQVIKEKKAIHALELFLQENLTDELIGINICTGSENIVIHINKIQNEGKHIGYNCILERTAIGVNPLKNEKITSELSELFAQTIKTGNKLVNELNLDFQKRHEILEFIERKFEKLQQDSVEIILAVQKIDSVSSKTIDNLTILPRFPNLAIRNVMILDNDILIHFVTKSTIKDMLPGINTYSFTDMVEAVEFLDTHPTDIILVDLEILKLSSWSFLDLIDKQGVKAPVIIISNSVYPETLSKLPKFPQIKGILTKPIDKKQLINILSE